MMAKPRLWLPKFCGSKEWRKTCEGYLRDQVYLEFKNYFNKGGIDFSIVVAWVDDWLYAAVSPIQNPLDRLTRCLPIKNQSELNFALIGLEMDFRARASPSWKLTSDESDLSSG